MLQVVAVVLAWLCVAPLLGATELQDAVQNVKQRSSARGNNNQEKGALKTAASERSEYKR